VRRIVEEEKLDPERISPTGKDGRLTKSDVLAAVGERKSVGEAVSFPGVTAPPPSVEQNQQSADGRFTRKRMSPLRRKIAAQLVMAQQTAAILTTFNECDMSAVQELRAKSQEKFTKKNNVKLGLMSFFIKACVEALKAVPVVNGRIEGDDFIQNNFYDIGVAVGTERGLVVPIVRDADKKSFADLERDIADFASRARDGKLKIEDLQGGTFTITNGGVYGSLFATPILNPPQSGILGMHKIMPRPVAVDGKVEVRPMMYLALSYDHRAIDGKEAVTFLIKVKECIEDPKKLPVDL
jgi:2-oxoglutarate dehydrogenase E2 component (dihydrolipoamide succinyltransferase)